MCALKLNVNDCEHHIFPRKYVLPNIICNFPSLRNPMHEFQENEEWMEWSFKLSGMNGQQYRRVVGTGLLIHYFYPFCDDINRMEALVKYGAQLFVLDEHIECNDVSQFEERLSVWRKFSQIFEKLENKKSYISMKGWNPFIISLYTIMEEIYESYNGVQKKRFLKEWRRVIAHGISENKFIKRGDKHVSVDELQKTRISSSGARIALQAIEFSEKIFIPEHIWDDPRIQTLINLASIHIYELNDIYSFEKELKEIKDINKMFNTVAVLSIVEELDIEMAMKRVAQRVAQKEEEILDLEAIILNDVDCLDETKVFINVINHICGGNYEYSLVSDRYNKYL